MATRNLTEAFKTALAASTLRPLIFAELVFSVDTYRLCNCRSTRSWDSKSWLGAGMLVRAGDIDETENERTTSFSIVLEGASTLFTSVLLNQAQQNRTGTVWFGLEDTSTGEIVVDPYLAFRGYLDTVDFDYNTDSSIISLNYQNENGMLDRSSAQRYTPSTQQYYYPTDLGFEYVAAIENWSGYWGQPE